jgi:hypothetical protein
LTHFQFTAIVSHSKHVKITRIFFYCQLNSTGDDFIILANMQLNLNLNKKREMSKKLRFFHFCHGLKMAFKNRLKLFDSMSVYKSIIQ